MSVLIQENNANFTKIANSLIVDKSLSNGAKVLYCYLRSKPNQWKIINSDIENSLNISQDSIAKYFKELLDNGWIERSKEKNEKGLFTGGYDYILFDLPKKSGYGKNPDTEEIHIPKNSGNNNKTKTSINTKTTKKTFIPPTEQEIFNHLKEKGYEKVTNGKDFYIHYNTTDWHYKDGTKVKSWKGALGTWISNAIKYNPELAKLIRKDKKEEIEPIKQEPIFKFEQKSLTEEEKKELASMLKD